MLERQRLFWGARLYDLEGSSGAFLAAMRANCAYHIRRCPDYRAVARALDFHPDQLNTEADLARIPPIPTLFYKRRALFSMPERRMALRVTSSGTQRSTVSLSFDWGCILAEVPMVLKLGAYHGLISPVPAHCVVLGYQPRRGKPHRGHPHHVGADLLLPSPGAGSTPCAPGRGAATSPTWTGRPRALDRLARSRFPTRIIGFPSYLWFGLKRMEELGLSVRLPRGSKILLAGGWKQHYAQEVDKSLLYALADRVLGIPEGQIHEFFGAVEHPIFYNACPRHHFHIPAYARVIIRDPETLEPLPMGEAGLVNLISPSSTPPRCPAS